MSTVETSIAKTAKTVGIDTLDIVEGLASFFGLGGQLKTWIRQGAGNVTPEAALSKLQSLMSQANKDYSSKLQAVQDKLDGLSGIIPSPTIQSFINQVKQSAIKERNLIQNAYNKTVAAYETGTQAANNLSTSSTGQYADKGKSWSNTVESSIADMQSSNEELKKGGNK